MDLKQIIDRSVYSFTNESWFHGSPDSRDVEKTGFVNKTQWW